MVKIVALLNNYLIALYSLMKLCLKSCICIEAILQSDMFSHAARSTSLVITLNASLKTAPNVYIRLQRRRFTPFVALIEGTHPSPRTKNISEFILIVNSERYYQQSEFIMISSCYSD